MRQSHKCESNQLNVRVVFSSAKCVMHEVNLCFFVEDIQSKELCTQELTENDLIKLKDAIEDLYYFEFVIGNVVFSACIMYYVRSTD